MAMSAWALLAAPLMASQGPVAAEDPEAAQAMAFLGDALLQAAEIQADAQGEGFGFGESDVFGGLSALDQSTMSGFSGGESTAIDIGALGVNIADNTGVVDNTTTTNSINGAITGNTIGDNNGITTVFNNTGNGVIFQSTVNVNIFMDGAN
jgi:hypothetical protein